MQTTSSLQNTFIGDSTRNTVSASSSIQVNVTLVHLTVHNMFSMEREVPDPRNCKLVTLCHNSLVSVKETTNQIKSESNSEKMKKT